MTHAAKARVNRRAFLHHLQDGLCYLAITPGCRARKRRTRLNVGGKAKDAATIEHVIARSKMKSGDPELLLIACNECNMAKGDRDPLDPMHVTKAEAFRAEWIEYSDEEQKRCDERRARKRLKKRGGFENPDLGIGPLPFPTRRWTEADTRRLDADLSARGITTKASRAAALGVTDARFVPGAKKHPNIPLGSAREQMAATLSRAERNAESQAAARRGIEARAWRLGIPIRKPPTR